MNLLICVVWPNRASIQLQSPLQAATRTKHLLIYCILPGQMKTWYHAGMLTWYLSTLDVKHLFVCRPVFDWKDIQLFVILETFPLGVHGGPGSLSSMNDYSKWVLVSKSQPWVEGLLFERFSCVEGQVLICSMLLKLCHPTGTPNPANQSFDIFWQTYEQSMAAHNLWRHHSYCMFVRLGQTWTWTFLLHEEKLSDEDEVADSVRFSDSHQSSTFITHDMIFQPRTWPGCFWWLCICIMHILVEYTGQTGVLLMKVHTETVDFKVLERLSFQAFFRHPLCHAISRQCAFSLECGMGVWTHVYIYIYRCTSIRAATACNC